uniref:Uncharacterized protein n=1 Tax=viral metagenome TaxID=1070528 RepID=A0A2V0R990_9ZZZZ
MSMLLDINVKPRKRNGFRNASAPFMLKCLSKETISRLRKSEVGQGVEPATPTMARRRDQLANDIGISPELMEQEIGKLFYELNNEIHPGVLNESEISKSKGAFDLRSVICEKLAEDASKPVLTEDDRLETIAYHTILIRIYEKTNPTVKYTDSSKIIKHGDGMLVFGGTRLLNYLYVPGDVRRIYDNVKFKLHNKDDAVILSSSVTMSSDRMTMAINVDVSNEHTHDLISKIRMTNYITYGDRNVVAPFIIESMGLDRGTIVIHLFTNSIGEALTHWMDDCTRLFLRMFASVVNTLKTQENGEAYYSPGLGGQLPIDFFRALRGTIEAINDNGNIERISISTVVYELFSAYAASTDGTLSNRRLRSVFGGFQHLESFLKSFITLFGCFDRFNRIASYNKLDERGTMKPYEERKRTSDMVADMMNKEVGLTELTRTVVESADKILARLRTGGEEFLKLAVNEANVHITNMSNYMR